MLNFTRSFVFSLVTLIVPLVGCGGGGGGDFSGPAQIEMNLTRGKIDTGDRVTVTIFISTVIEDGIMLKVRAPKGLDYVTDSGFLKVSGVRINLDPAVNKGDTTHNYIVYFLGRNLFGEDNYGELSVEFQGSEAIADGVIEADPDINDTTVADSKEFDIATPKFSAEASAKIKVTG